MDDLPGLFREIVHLVGTVGSVGRCGGRSGGWPVWLVTPPSSPAPVRGVGPVDAPPASSPRVPALRRPPPRSRPRPPLRTVATTSPTDPWPRRYGSNVSATTARRRR